MYDLIIIGGGPAGLNAAIYAARYKLKTLVVASDTGGQAIDAPLIDNYAGYQEISGIELMGKFKQHVGSLGVEIKTEKVAHIVKDKKGFVVNKDKAKALILALGTEKRKLGCQGEDGFAGKGVSYCATCDAPMFTKKIVGVVGGGDSAVRSALLIAEHAKKVLMFVRKDHLRSEPILVDKVKKSKKIDVKFNVNVTEIMGDKFVHFVKLDNKKLVELDGLFVDIGYDPNTEVARMLEVGLDEDNYIKVDSRQETDVENVYAAGDCTTGSGKLKQIITAAAEGAVAARSVYEKIKQ